MSVGAGMERRWKGAGHAGLPSLHGRLDALRRRRVLLRVVAALAVIVLLALVLIGGPSSGGYTSAERDSFVAGCLRNGGATAAQCGCMFDRISAQLPYDAYARAHDTWSLRTSRVFSAAVIACTSTS